VDLGHPELGISPGELEMIASGEKMFGADMDDPAVNRFKNACEKNCFNKKVILSNIGIGPQFIKELVTVMSVNRNIT